MPAVTLLLGALCCLAGEQGQLPAWSEDDALRMELAVLAVPRGNLQRARLKLTVTNTSTNALVLDKDMVAGFSLRFRTDLSDELIHSDDKDVEWREVRQLAKPKTAAARRRFVTMKHGFGWSAKRLECGGLPALLDRRGARRREQAPRTPNASRQRPPVPFSSFVGPRGVAWRLTRKRRPLFPV